MTSKRIAVLKREVDSKEHLKTVAVPAKQQVPSTPSHDLKRMMCYEAAFQVPHQITQEVRSNVRLSFVPSNSPFPKG